MVKQIVFFAIGITLFACFLVLSYLYFDWPLLKHALENLWKQPFWLAGMFASYGLAFALRAWAWKLYLNADIGLGTYLNALFCSLFVNHLFPVKAGDIARVGYVARREEVKWDEALHSVIVMRVLDIACLVLLASLGAFWFGTEMKGWLPGLGFIIPALGIALFLVLPVTKRSSFLLRHKRLLQSFFTSKNSALIMIAVGLSWLLEAFVVVGAARALSHALPFWAGVYVNSVTVAGQVFHWTPGGVGTYESVMSFSLYQMGWPLDEAYAAALLSHGWKFLFSYLVGIYVLIRSPGLWRDFKQWRKRKGERMV